MSHVGRFPVRAGLKVMVSAASTGDPAHRGQEELSFGVRPLYTGVEALIA